MSLTAEDEGAITALIAQLEARIGDARDGLPQPLFRLVSRLTPMVNVDLLIRNEAGQTLLTWRADEFYGPGWHVPGGIIRFKEHSTARIAAVAQSELGAEVQADPTPFQVSEIMASHRNVRGHFISFLYHCTLITPPDPCLIWDEADSTHGGWRWFDRCPDNLIGVHDIYRRHIAEGARFLQRTPC